MVEWARKLESQGAGELMLTSIDQDGTRNGFDIELIQRVQEVVSIPLIISGGGGTLVHIKEVCDHTSFDAISLASMLHYGLSEIITIKKEMQSASLRIRG